jgi:two-component system, chemotaxis family, CheB/CheR fusion protein
MAAPFADNAACPVLVVDDNVDSAETVAELLRLWGHDVCIAHDGEQALQKAREKRPDVVLLDIGLPDMDGYAVAEKLRTEGLVGRLLVAITGYSELEDRDRIKAAGFDRHLVKPVEPSELQGLFTG